MRKAEPEEMVNFSINIKQELIKKIEELAEKENRSRNNMISCLLDRAVKAEKEK